MRFGLFGKLQSKRDFVAVATPRTFLAVWEPWLQGGISASRMRLGEKWQEAFLTAPIWRFWLGADLCGTTAMGAIMPSMDGVGRYFPLTLVGFAEEYESLSPPELEPSDSWFSEIEEFLFSTLETERPFEAVTQALGQLPSAPAQTPVADNSVVLLAPIKGSAALAREGFAAAFARARASDHRNAYAAMSFWWTAGGPGYEPRALAVPRMPDPHLFTEMLTGDFGSAGSEDRVGEASL